MISGLPKLPNQSPEIKKPQYHGAFLRITFNVIRKTYQLAYSEFINSVNSL